MSTTQTTTIDFGHSLRDAVVAGILTMLVFSPITNFVLKQYSFTLDWFRSPFFLNGVAIGLIVAFVRFFVSVGAQTQTGQNFIQNFIKTEHGVEVEDEYADGGKRLRHVLLWGGGLMALFLALGLSGIIYRAPALPGAGRAVRHDRHGCAYTEAPGQETSVEGCAAGVVSGGPVAAFVVLLLRLVRQKLDQ
ncbi:inner-membrane translocator [Advenella kashmirensis WT001]|uniref:Inner-membrane translocator n=1 Tax=Advenella kashmirensis (strain DSM 17095 / LMG 22695 / WT001) TaxID=1036672 RepID=I3UHJ7_ADVKW|nr:inner-membrane translocator [Advenella kashmirensis WT001]